MNIDGSTGNKYQGSIITRPFDFGTDAIEKTRVSQGQSLIDADFEYGLQATKWQTYSDTRKMPSFFEIPGTDYVVTDVTTDAATPSVITVTANTQSAAPVVGNVINVQGLANGDNTFDRAQGFFIITGVTGAGPYTITDSAKGKVGTSSGSIFTSYTVARKAGYYSSISATAGNMNAPFGSINAGTNLTAGTGITAGTTINAGTTITAGTGNVQWN
jgi:hypothetical protein